MDVANVNHKESPIPTYRGWGCASIIDYTFISDSLEDRVVQAKVLPTVHGDHNPILTTIRLVPRPVFTKVPGARNVTHLTDNLRIIWKGIDNGKLFLNMITAYSPSIEVCLSFHDPNPEVVNAFCHLCAGVKGLISRPVSNTNSNPRWFNNACSHANRELRAALAVVPRDATLVGTMSHHYKQALRQRKEEILK